ncbi:MAG: divalent-cation tolerance protein CutA [Gammaproteobacteria bacterium]|nr:MAG: divalent-cation tolerance protein CutA [Gammaproteobacteria bacterium]
MHKQDKACVVIVTCASEEEAGKLAEELINRRLAACVQIVAVSSYYRWDGVVNYSQEKQLLIKTMQSRYAELEQTILEKHSYDCPEIIQLPIDGGFSGYLDWIKVESRAE